MQFPGEDGAARPDPKIWGKFTGGYYKRSEYGLQGGMNDAQSKVKARMLDLQFQIQKKQKADEKRKAEQKRIKEEQRKRKLEEKKQKKLNEEKKKLEEEEEEKKMEDEKLKKQQIEEFQQDCRESKEAWAEKYQKTVAPLNKPLTQMENGSEHHGLGEDDFEEPIETEVNGLTPISKRQPSDSVPLETWPPESDIDFDASINDRDTVSNAVTEENLFSRAATTTFQKQEIMDPEEMSYDQSAADINIIQKVLLQQRINDQMNAINTELQTESEAKRKAEEDARMKVLGLLDSDSEDDGEKDTDTPTFEEREEGKEMLKVESVPEFSDTEDVVRDPVEVLNPPPPVKEIEVKQFMSDIQKVQDVVNNILPPKEKTPEKEDQIEPIGEGYRQPFDFKPQKQMMQAQKESVLAQMSPQNRTTKKEPSPTQNFSHASFQPKQEEFSDDDDDEYQDDFEDDNTPNGKMARSDLTPDRYKDTFGQESERFDTNPLEQSEVMELASPKHETKEVTEKEHNEMSFKKKPEADFEQDSFLQECESLHSHAQDILGPMRQPEFDDLMFPDIKNSRPITEGVQS